MNVNRATITLPASTGTKSYSQSGGELPEAINMGSGNPFVRFFGVVTTTTGSAVDDIQLLEAYATATGGSETWTQFGMATDNSGSATTGEHYNGSGSVKIVNNVGTTLYEFTINSWDSDGFTINVTTASISARVQLIYGTTDTGAKVAVISSPTSTGTKDFTGFGWNPSNNAVCFTSGSHANTADPTTRSTNHFFAVGAFDEAAAFVHFQICSNGTVYAIGEPANSDSAALWSRNGGGTTAAVEANFSAWITDGFRLNFTSVVGSARYWGVLLLEDTDPCQVALWTTQAGTGSETFDTGSATGLTPKVVYLQSDGQAADYNVSGADVFLARGTATDSAEESAFGAYQDTNPSGASNSFVRNETTAVIHLLDISKSVSDDINFTSLEEDGFAVNHDTNGGAKFVGVALMGLAAGGGGGATGSPWYYYANQLAARGA